ncbi:hypothetical protein [Desulfonatronum sp. SC1]|uniref:hypothetical protein n=1 Tax=Desulfonatronum sp. SC1 TaxID=2109626 RepID=UPI000D31FA50|nr:hypothetical protein [Desulfonatronum sp. SC1]PTN34459.1 hypothetical protein C6366_12685 [Desulfonatronum sp. SC1]
MRRPFRTIAFVLTVLLITTLLGCSPRGTPWRLGGDLFHPALGELDWSLGHDRLARALSAYQREDYVEARSLFLRAALETDKVDILDRAMLGAVLSGLLSAEDVDAIERHLRDFDHLALRLGAGDVPLNPDLMRPVLQVALEFHAARQDSRVLRTEFEVKSKQVAALREEVTLLRSQVEELEALFQFLEQQKRQLSVPGVVN